MIKSEKLTQKKLKELIHYDPDKGVFIWKIGYSNNKGNIGNRAGCKYSNRYRYITINKKGYLEHRLAWFYMHGYFPENEIDHINRIKDDNRICNLREVRSQCNKRNSTIRKTNQSGITGVCWSEREQKWIANIKINDNATRLGGFKTKIGAAKARWEAEKKAGYPNCNTTSTAYLYIQGALKPKKRKLPKIIVK